MHYSACLAALTPMGVVQDRAYVSWIPTLALGPTGAALTPNHPGHD